MQYVATCNGSPMKIGTRAECLEYCQMQRRKLKGDGLANSPPRPGLAARAAEARWDVRSERPDDRSRLLNVMDAPWGRPTSTGK